MFIEYACSKVKVSDSSPLFIQFGVSERPFLSCWNGVLFGRLLRKGRGVGPGEAETGSAQSGEIASLVSWHWTMPATVAFLSAGSLHLLESQGRMRVGGRRHCGIVTRKGLFRRSLPLLALIHSQESVSQQSYAAKARPQPSAPTMGRSFLCKMLPPLRTHAAPDRQSLLASRSTSKQRNLVPVMLFQRYPSMYATLQ